MPPFPTLRSTSCAVLACATLLTPAARADDFVLPADPTDFELRQELEPLSPNYLNITVQAINADTLDIWKDFSFEYRGVEEFDLTPLLAAGDTVTSAVLSMERVFSIYPNGSVQVQGIAANRAALLSGNTPAAIAAWSTADDVLLDGAFAPNVAPNPADEVFTLDVTAFLQGRLDDALATPADALIAFRLQRPSGSVDLRFTSANAPSGSRPTLRVTVVPEPATAAFAGLGALALLRRRRR